VGDSPRVAATLCLSSDPLAWMRPYFDAVAAREGFAHLSPSHRFAALVDAIAQDHPAKSAELRDWEPAMQRAALQAFADRAYDRPGDREVELWRVTKDSRELRCLEVYMPTGIDLRVMEGEDFRRTQLLRDGPAVEEKAVEWRKLLGERGGR
jgi:hypothetical protein